MATALVKGVISSGVVAAENVIGVARSEASRRKFSEITGARNCSDIAEVVRESDVLMLATKPYDIATILKAGEMEKFPHKLLLSVAAGVTLETMDAHTGHQCKVVRSMPNTPSLVGKGATAFCMGGRCDDSDREIVKSILGAVGLVIEMPEKIMNAATGVSGSGPAYIYMVIEAMADGGVRAGLPRADAIKLAAQTVSGAAEMVLSTGEHPGVLKDMVTSPGGTTITAVATLERHNIRSAFIEAVGSAAARADELGKS